MTGIELIAQERAEQLEKHDISVYYDVNYNFNEQLLVAAIRLLEHVKSSPPSNWDKGRWSKMWNKSHEQRLVIAGAFIAAELDRLMDDET